jgi:outer membrane protein assembly factor BamA
LLVATTAAGQPSIPHAPAPKPSREGSAPRLYSIAIEGAPADSLLADLPVQPGDPLDGREIREAVRHLHATARFARVAAFVEQVPASELPPGFAGAVRLVFVVKLVQRLAAVSFPGRAALPDSLLLQTTNLQVKTEFQPESLWRAAEAIRAAYYRIGYRHVQVRPVPRDTPDGIALEMRIEEGQPTRIEEVRFTGELGLGREQLAAAFKLSSGDVLNLAVLEESVHGVRSRYRQAGLLRARVNPPVIEELDAGRARVTVPVAAGPPVRFHIRGNRAFTDALLLSKLGLDSAVDEPLDTQVAAEMASRLRRFYVSAGWFGARVVQREMVADDGAVQIVFAVDEQQRLWVEELRFDGNRSIRSAQLRDLVLDLLRETISTDAYPGADPGEVASTGVMGRIPDPPKSHTRIEPTRVFDPIVYARALRQIEDLYKSQGYLSARAGPPKLSSLKLPGQVAVTIPIVEGDRAIVSHVAVEGSSVVPARELESALALRQGGAFSYLAAEEGRVALTQLFTRRGYLYARVEDEETFVEQEPGDAPGVQEVRVRYRIQEGPVVRVALIEVIGHRRTKEDLIRDLIAMRAGDILTPEVLDRGQQQLLRTGLFFSATLTPLNPEVAEAQKTVQVALRERPRVDVVVSGGFSLADGPRATFQYIQGNLFGRNLTFSAVAKADYPFIRYLQAYDHKCTAQGGTLIQCEAGYQPPRDPIERVIDLGFFVPRLSPLTDKLRFGVDLIHQRSVRASYQLTKVSTQFSTGLTSRRPFDLGLTYEVGYQEFTHENFSIEDYLAGIDPAVFRQPSGKFLLGSLRPTATLDLRDDPGRPRSGFYAQIGGDYLSSLLGDSCTDSSGQKCTVNLFKWQGLIAGYVPLPGLASLLLTIHAGRVIPIDPSSKTPGDRRFYLGGATKLRGFREDAVQPQDLVDSLHREVSACQATVTSLGCSQQVQALQTFGTSDGGDQFLLLNAELRIPIATSLELAGFYDAGNLWLRPRSFVTRLGLRDALGFGLRYATPIGRMAIDIAVNLNPDTSFNEPRVLPYFSIDTL